MSAVEAEAGSVSSDEMLSEAILWIAEYMSHNQRYIEELNKNIEICFKTLESLKSRSFASLAQKNITELLDELQWINRQYGTSVKVALSLKDAIASGLYNKFNLSYYSDADCIALFRFTKQQISEILQGFKLSESPSLLKNKHYRVGEEELLCMTLFRLSSTCTLAHMIPFFLRPPDTMSRAITSCIRYLSEKYKHRLELDLKYLTKERLSSFAVAIRSKAHILGSRRTSQYPTDYNVCSFVDGTTITTARPMDEALQSLSYNGWKHLHGLKMQICNGADGMIWHASRPTYMSENDITHYTLSGLDDKLKDIFKISEHCQLHLFGDKAYSSFVSSKKRREGVMKAMKKIYRSHPLAERRARNSHNMLMSRLRVCNEWTMKEFSAIFPYAFSGKLRLSWEDVESSVRVSVFLANVRNTFHRNQTSRYFGVEPMGFKEYISLYD